jgi:hypothetical protein
MAPTPYKIHHIRRRSTIGVTAASLCTLNAVLKFDCDESPFCVYNEYVTTKLAQTLHMPVADGVLTSTGDGPAFASLEVASPGLSLPDLLESQRVKAAGIYPNEVAALVAFDILIGNDDRARNLKASLATPHIKVFKAFDHSHCLLTIEEDPEESLKQLRQGQLIVRFHPFYGIVRYDLLDGWAKRIAAVDDIYFQECCDMGKTFRAVTVDLQNKTCQALTKRKKELPAIIRKHLGVISPCQP